MTFTSPRLAETERERIYDSGYFDSGAVNMDVDYTAEAAIFENDAAERFKLVSNYCSENSLDILEIGSAAGFFLNECPRRGHRPTGVEISSEMCDYARNRFGVKCHHGRIDDVDFGHERFDVLAMWHVLEHLPRPVETMKTLMSVLRPDAWVFITVPNLDSGNAKRFGASWRHLQPEVHLSHFSPDTLKRLFRELGVETVGLTKSGGTGLLGRSSEVNAGLKRLLVRHVKQLNMARQAIKWTLTNLLGRDDFVTIIGRRR